MEPANVIVHPHAMQRLSERGATESEVEAYAVLENKTWIVITVIVKFF